MDALRLKSRALENFVLSGICNEYDSYKWQMVAVFHECSDVCFENWIQLILNWVGNSLQNYIIWCWFNVYQMENSSHETPILCTFLCASEPTYRRQLETRTNQQKPTIETHHENCINVNLFVWSWNKCVEHLKWLDAIRMWKKGVTTFLTHLFALKTKELTTETKQKTTVV